MTPHNDAAALGGEHQTKGSQYYRQDAAIAREVQESIQIYIIEDTHNEEYHRVGQQFACQGYVYGVIAHA